MQLEGDGPGASRTVALGQVGATVGEDGDTRGGTPDGDLDTGIVTLERREDGIGPGWWARLIEGEEDLDVCVGPVDQLGVLHKGQ